MEKGRTSKFYASNPKAAAKHRSYMRNTIKSQVNLLIVLDSIKPAVRQVFMEKVALICLTTVQAILNVSR